ncbi:MAG: PQQ-binding-like beta-propeller repeat protein, partial [Verrucomicrobiota bacterium]
MNRFSFAVALSSLLFADIVFGIDNWPQFRGPDGNGHSDAKGLPLIWSETNNVKWKTPIHGRAWSSPVILGDQIWMTTATEDGTALFAVCVDRDSGKIVHDRNLFHVALPQYVHPFNSYASPSPVIEGDRVYVTFGAPATACLDTKSGKVLWERRDFVCNHFRGAGSSPILFGDLLIMNFDGSDHQFVVALDKHTGKTVWRTERSIDYKDLGEDGKPKEQGDWRKAFSTPHVAMFEGNPILISSGAKAHYAYNPVTGEELWRVEERTCHSAGCRPVTGHGLIFLPTGWSTGQLLAIRPGKKGEVIDANDPPQGNSSGANSPPQLQVVWKVKRSVAKKPSLLLIDDLLFMIEDGGVASCIEAKTGAGVWQERLGGEYSASPV